MQPLLVNPGITQALRGTPVYLLCCPQAHNPSAAHSFQHQRQRLPPHTAQNTELGHAMSHSRLPCSHCWSVHAHRHLTCPASLALNFVPLASILAPLCKSAAPPFCRSSNHALLMAAKDPLKPPIQASPKLCEAHLCLCYVALKLTILQLHTRSSTRGKDCPRILHKTQSLAMQCHIAGCLAATVGPFMRIGISPALPRWP